MNVFQMQEAWAVEVSKNPQSSFNSWCRGYEAAAGIVKPEEKTEVMAHIGVDVTATGTYVVAFNCRANGVRECFYAEWHPLTEPKQEVEVCCGRYEKCLKACTPRGEWLAKKALAQPEQSKYSDIVSDGGLDPRNKFDAQSEQEPEIVRRVKRYTGKRRESVGSPHINAKECIALANWIDSMLAAPPRKPWVWLTDADLMKEFGYTDELLRDTAYRVEQIIKRQNT